MSKTCLTPVNGYDIPALERWLEEKAARGLLFSMTLGPLTCFEEGEAAQVRVHLEPAREKTEEEDPAHRPLRAGGVAVFGGVSEKFLRLCHR